MINHGGNQGATHDAAGDRRREGALRGPCGGRGRRRRHPWWACHQEWPRSSPQKEAITAARRRRQAGRGRASRSWSRRSPLMRMWYMSLDSSAHPFPWRMINASARRAHFVTSAHQLPGARIDLLARAKRRPLLRVWAGDGDSLVDVRRVPLQKLRHALERTEKKGRALVVASHLSEDEGRTKTGPSSTNHSSQTTLASR